MLTRIAGALLVVAFASVAGAGMVEVELIPDNPGPYYGGELLTVDVWLHSQVDYDVGLRRVQFDFTGTDSAILLGPTFEFDYSSIPNNIGGYVLTTSLALPIPSTYMSLDCGCPSALIQLPGERSVHIGSLGVRLPEAVGTYWMDALAPGESDPSRGGRITALLPPPAYPEEYWTAFAGDITGGGYDYQIIPEPGSMTLLLLGGLALYRRNPLHRWNASRPSMVITGWGLLLAVPGSAFAQTGLVPAQTVEVDFDSGFVSASPWVGDGPVVVFADVLSVVQRPWIRLHFAHVELGGAERSGNGSFIRITSLEDGSSQVLDSSALGIWRDSSGYFNGHKVLVELYAFAGTGDNRVVVDKVLAGARNEMPEPSSPEGGAECQIDDRVRSYDDRVARVLYEVPAGLMIATAFLVDDRAHCFFSAGHACKDFDFTREFVPVVEFNVDESDSEGNIQFASTQDTYVVDEESVVHRYSQNVIHRDWCYFGTEDNTATGLSPYEVQGDSFRLPYVVPYPGGQTLRVTGHGFDAGSMNATQQTDTGAYLSRDIFGVLTYDIFTTFGVSGAPVEAVCPELVYGIHTRGGCPPGNIGVAVDMSDLKDALVANWIDTGYYQPQGVCGAPLDCNENGIDDYCDISCIAPGCSEPCGDSDDCNDNGIPDDCEPDCNSNGVVDSCDIEEGTSADANGNAIPDECDARLYVDQSATESDDTDGSSW